jgi:hypothetical protein
MADQQGTLQTIGTFLAEVLRPLQTAFSGVEPFKGLMLRLGWRPTDLPPEYTNLVTTISVVVDKLDSLSDDPSPNDILDLVNKGVAAFNAVRSISTAPPGVDAGAFLGEIAERLFELLLTDYLAAEQSSVYNLLRALNVITRERHASAPGRPAFARVKFDWDALPKIISDPGSIPQQVFCWGTPDLDAQKVVDYLAALFFALKFPVRVRVSDDATVRAYAGGSLAPVLPTSKTLNLTFYSITIAGNDLEAGFRLRPLPASGSHLPGFALEPLIPSQFPLKLQLADDIALRVLAGTNAPDLFGLVVRPDGAALVYPFASGTPPSAGIGIGFDFTPADPVILLGETGGTRLQLKGGSIDLSAIFGGAGLEIALNAQLSGLALILSPGEGDGFIHEIIGDSETTIAIPLGVQWSNLSGFSFKGSAAFEVSLYPHLQLGPLSVEVATISLTAPSGGPPRITLKVTAGISGALGPVKFVVQDIGLAADVVFQAGNAGPFGIDLGFKPPDGIGLAIEAEGTVTGGGFLFHDPAQSLYAGSLMLSLSDTITLTAFGLIATRMPDGSRGYSLIIFITAEDFEPIPLGLGFTLQGIGGMVAVNRTFDQDALRAGMQNDTLKSLLFPQDPVGNAPAIIRALASAFPAQRGSYLLGILAKIGWFTPTLIELDLALILEFGARDRLLVLGRISSLLPSPDDDLVRINLDAVGVLDFDQDTASIDAMLVDSRLVHKYALTGAAALRAGWGSAESTEFVLSIGGFNPRFAPPAGVPPLARVQIALSSGKNPQLSCDAYFAITSNTIQFGADAQLYAEAYGFSISGDVGFDVLITRAPLHFIADFHASVQLKHGSDNLFKVSVEGELEGPLPLRLSGKASFEIFWCDFSVRFDTTLIQGEPPPLPLAVDVLAQLEAALSTPQSWSTQLAPNHTHGVALRKLAPGTGLVLDPLGRLVVNEGVVPLHTGRDIDTFGGAPVAGSRRFALSVALNGVALTETQPLQAAFAPGQFFAMSDDEELASPSFETMESGLVVGTDAVSFDAGQLVAAPVEYQAITIDPQLAAPPPGSYTLPATLLALHSLSGAAARAPLRRLGRARFRSAAPAAVSLEQPNWAIVPLDAGTPVALDPSIKTWTDYRAALATLNRGGAGFQLVPARDIAA